MTAQDQPEATVAGPTSDSSETPSRRSGTWGLSVWPALVILTTLGGMLWLVQTTQDDLRERDRATEMRAISQAISASMDQAGSFALAQAEALARQPAIGPALAAGQRDELLALSRPTYDYLKAQAGVSVFGFHSKDLRYLLRVHKLESFNDDISRLRPMVLAANSTRQAQSGLEMGVSGIVGVRGVAVVHDKELLQGTAEVGVDLQPLIELVKTSTNADVAVIISSSLSGFTPGKDFKQATFGDLILSAATDHALFTRLLRDDLVHPSRDVLVRELSIDGRRHAMVVQPLVDYSGRMIGSLLAIKDRSEREALIHRSRIELWVLALCGGLLAWVVLRVLLQRRLQAAGAGQ